MGQSLSTENASKCTLEIPGKGTLTGLSFKSSRTGNTCVNRFAHVPYAKPCFDKTRFTLPQPLSEDFDYTGDYTELALKCPQPSVPNPKFNYIKSPSNEKIQYMNIWVPSSDKYKPKTGWPVMIHLHGGWLQYNEPNGDQFNIIEMLDDDEFHEKFILVVPGYRLNMFGFLSGKELLEENSKNSNFGFWDQRLAMEWTYENIKYFGGDAEKISVSGLSAGSYSLFFQLAYEIYNPKATQIIKQCIFSSNLVYVQPKTIEECQNQFDEIIEKLEIPQSLSASEKLAKLRALDTNFIEDFIPKLKLHTFRAVTDGHFIHPDLIKDLASGKFASLVTKKGIRIMNGEVDNEPLKYSLLNTPLTIEDLPIQIENYYPKHLVPTLMDLYATDDIDTNLPEAELKEEIRKKYGAIIGDGQVYASARGFINKLVENGFPSSDIFRYRVSYRAKWLDAFVEPENDVPHAADITIWFYNLRKGYTEDERNVTHKWLVPYMKFLNFEKDIEDWPTNDHTKYRLFQKDGSAAYVEDKQWDWGVKVSNTVYTAQA